jgi:radical SAM protein with 4Fe4S-binding SPASM domain
VNILEELKPLKIDQITLSLSYAGESLLHPQFCQMAKEASDLGFRKLQLATNGTLLNTMNIRVLAECFSELAVSFHKSHLLHKVMENTKKLYKATRGTEASMRINVVAQEFTKRERGKMRRLMMGYYDDFKVFPMITERCRTTGPGFEKQPACPMHYFYLAILWNGESLPCCHILSPGGWSMGNIYDSSIKEVFHGEVVNMLRQNILKGTPCEHCNIYT